MLIITCICWSVQIIVNVSDNLLIYYFYLAPSNVLVMSAFIFMAHSLQDNFVAGGSNQLSSFRMWFSSPQKFEHARMNVDLCQSKSVYIIVRSSFQVYYYITHNYPAIYFLVFVFHPCKLHSLVSFREALKEINKPPIKEKKYTSTFHLNPGQ